MIIIYAGAQADEDGRETPRLPAVAEEPTLVRLRGLFDSLKPRILIGALASGSDILIAEAGARENVQLDIHLPFNVDKFKELSVSPRGSTWDRRFEALIEDPKTSLSAGNLDPDDENVYTDHNLGIIDRAMALARPGERVWALVIRSVVNPAEPTISDDFANRASTRGLFCLDIDPLVKGPRVFIAMSYGRKFDPLAKTSYDCDQVFHKVYRPVLEDLDLNWTRADLQTDSGTIHVGMIDDLANSRLVIADLATLNFNVAYELGLRHVLAPHSTILVNPTLSESKDKKPPFDVGMVRAVTFDRSIDLTDEQAEEAIRRLKPVLLEALKQSKMDSPVHEWFDLDQIRGPYYQRTHRPDQVNHEIDVRNSIKLAIRSSNRSDMLAATSLLSSDSAISEDTRVGLRLELGAGLLNEGAYEDAIEVLAQAEPPTESNLHRAWLQKMVMAYRRAGESAPNEDDCLLRWNQAELLLGQALDLGYTDSETYGIYGGLIKKQLSKVHSEISRASANARLDLMRNYYQKGFETDPSFYIGVNLVMALRIKLKSADTKEDSDEVSFSEALLVSKFLVRLALAEDSHNFWAAITQAELLLHEALHRGGEISSAATAYARATLLASVDQRKAALSQLEFLEQWGDPPEVVEVIKNALLEK